jgi:hypothetical protein
MPHFPNDGHNRPIRHFPRPGLIPAVKRVPRTCPKAGEYGVKVKLRVVPSKHVLPRNFQMARHFSRSWKPGARAPRRMD